MGDKKVFVPLGVGITIGVIVAVILIFVVRAKPSSVTVGPVEFELPADTVLATTPIDNKASPVPTSTSTPTPTSTPESECPQGLNCYRSGFDELDPTLFCTTPQSGYELQMGQLIVTAEGDTAYEIHPCESLAWNLQFVELTLTIEQMSGQPGHAFAGIGTSLSQDRYLYIQLDSGGNAFVEHGLGGNPSERDTTIQLNEIGTPHKLRVEFTGQEAIFFIDDTQIDTEISSEGLGNWFLLNVSAWPSASITVKLDEVMWGVVP
jgi:hypothetical protein